MNSFHVAFRALNHQGKFLKFMVLVAPLGLIISDAAESGNGIWHDLWQISTTVIGMLVLMLVRSYLNKQKELEQAITEIKKDRDNIQAQVRIAYAQELGIVDRRQKKLIEVLVQIVFKLYPESAAADVQKIIKDLMADEPK